MDWESELRNLLQELTPADVEWIDLPSLGGIAPKHRSFGNVKNDLLRRIESCLSRFDETAMPSPRFLNLGEDAKKIDLTSISRKLVGNALEHGPDNAVSGLKSFIQSDQVIKKTHFFFLGPVFNDPFALNEALELLPFTKLNSSAKAEFRRIAPNASRPDAFRLTFPRPIEEIIPTTVATLTQKFSPKWLDAQEGIETPANLESRKKAKSEFALLDSLRELLPLVDVREIRPMLQFYEFEDWLPVGMWSIQRFHMYERTRETRYVRPWGPQQLDELKRVIDQYARSTDGFRQKVRVGIQRFHFAQKEHDPADKAIDLGIAVESLLAQDLDQMGTIGHQIKMRGALLLGEDLAARKQIFRKLGELYTCRSIASHTGVLPNQPSKLTRPSDEVLSDGFVLVAGIVKSFLESGIPNWHDLVLGPGLTTD